MQHDWEKHSVSVWMLVTERTCVEMDKAAAVLLLIFIDTAVQLEAELNWTQTERVILVHMGRQDNISSL